MSATLNIKHDKWDKAFKSGLSKFCGRQHLKNLSASTFKGCLPQNVLSPLLNTLSQMTWYWGTSFRKHNFFLLIFHPETYLEPCQTSLMELFCTSNSWRLSLFPWAVAWKLPPGKLPPGWFPPNNSHPENFHQRKFPSRKSPTWTTPTQENSHLENSHPGKLPPGKLPPGKFPPGQLLPRKAPTQKIATRIIPTQEIPTWKNFYPANCYPG